MNEDTRICLISRWKLKDGLDESLLDTLRLLAGQVEDAEPQTLMYRVHLQSDYPLDGHFCPLDPPPPDVPLSEQTEVTFLEVYQNAEAFSRHVKGEVFNEFLTSTLKYFEEDPNRNGWPVTATTFLDLQSGLVREGA